jgi:hypothetical protein
MAGALVAGEQCSSHGAGEARAAAHISLQRPARFPPAGPFFPMAEHLHGWRSPSLVPHGCSFRCLAPPRTAPATSPSWTAYPARPSPSPPQQWLLIPDNIFLVVAHGAQRRELPPSPMHQHVSSPPPSSSLSWPGNTGSRALSLVWVEQRLPCYLLPDAPSRWHPTAPTPSLLRLTATAARVPSVRQNVKGDVLLQRRRRPPCARCFAQPPIAPSKLVVRNPRCPRYFV